MKVIIFSRTFPAYHPRKGEHTFFVEKFLKGFEKENWYADNLYDVGQKLGFPYADVFLNRVDSMQPKNHTIRAGHRWKVGDKFSPRIWSGKPYRSKQIVIAPDIEIKNVWDFKLIGGHCFTSWKEYLNDDDLKIIAKNDGLSLDDFIAWFNNFSKNCEYQIICWSDSISY